MGASRSNLDRLRVGSAAAICEERKNRIIRLREAMFVRIGLAPYQVGRWAAEGRHASDKTSSDWQSLRKAGDALT